MELDGWVVEQLNGLVSRWSPVADAASWAARDLQLVFVATLIVGGLVEATVELRRRRLEFQLVEGAAVALMALGFGLVLNQVIGAIWFRPRPFDAVPGLHLLVAPSADPSFPSDHATAVFALALGIGVALPWLRNILLLEGVVLLMARVAVGLHFPSDMAAGLCIALLAVAAAEQVNFHARQFLHAVVTRTIGRLVSLGDPADTLGRQEKQMVVGAVFAALVGMPAVIETAADPIRFHPAGIEDAVLFVLLGGLTAIAIMIVRSGRFARAVGATSETRGAV